MSERKIIDEKLSLKKRWCRTFPMLNAEQKLQYRQKIIRFCRFG